MKYSEALELMLREGKRMTRTGWNGMGMFIYITKGRTIPAADWTGPADLIIPTPEPHVSILGHIDMKTANGSICIGWLASQTDMLADDWVTVE